MAAVCHPGADAGADGSTQDVLACSSRLPQNDSLPEMATHDCSAWYYHCNHPKLFMYLIFEIFWTFLVLCRIESSTKQAEEAEVVDRCQREQRQCCSG